jgi:hypothetical protein
MGRTNRYYLACATDKQNQEVAAAQGMFVAQVSKWCRCFAEYGFAGLEEEQRPGSGSSMGERVQRQAVDQPGYPADGRLAPMGLPNLGRGLGR